MKFFLNNRVIAKISDITNEDIDVIVNAANSSLLGGGGVDGAIHRVGGPDILDECKRLRKSTYINGLPTGKAVITTAGRMKAKAVIHTVGPIYKNGTKEKQLLYNCYANSLKLCIANNFESIAFPAISTGAYGYPKFLAAKISSTAISDFLKKNKSVKLVALIFYKDSDYEIFINNHVFE